MPDSHIHYKLSMPSQQMLPESRNEGGRAHSAVEGEITHEFYGALARCLVLENRAHSSRQGAETLPHSLYDAPGRNFWFDLGYLTGVSYPKSHV
jgi:hypothetical protein